MTGFLVPAWYQAPAPAPDDMYIASFVWGFSVACSIFTAVKGFQQTLSSWKRSRRVSQYIIMVWLEWLSSITMGALCWLFLRGIIEPSFQLFFSLVCLWVIQIQVLIQIIINRVSLLMIRRRKANKLKWCAAIILGLINISVFIIWIPARLQISTTYIYVNNIWDRIEKVIFCLVDGSLNLYFIHLVRSKLIANGLTKYIPLFRFNLLMVGISVSLDIILIGVMSLRDGFIYVQFHPLVYLIKLHIEMNNADLITKVVKATNPNELSSSHVTEWHSSSKSRAQPRQSIADGIKTHVSTMLSGNHGHIKFPSDGAHEAPMALNEIQKTVSTTVVSRLYEDDEIGSESSSTRQLKR